MQDHNSLDKVLARMAASVPPKVRTLRIPGLGRIAVTTDPGEGGLFSEMACTTELLARHYDKHGNLLEARTLGSGVIVIGLVNTIVSDAVTGTTAIPTLARYKYMDTGTGATAATDGNTALQTPVTSGIARPVATLTNGQTATTGNHAAILTYSGTCLYNSVGPSYPIAITEWGMFDSAGTSNPLTGGNLMDHRIFAAFNVNSGDQIAWTYNLTLPSNN